MPSQFYIFGELELKMKFVLWAFCSVKCVAVEDEVCTMCGVCGVCGVCVLCVYCMWCVWCVWCVKRASV